MKSTSMIDRRIPEMHCFADHDQQKIERRQEQQEMYREFNGETLVVHDERETGEEDNRRSSDTNNQVMKQIQIEDMSSFNRSLTVTTNDEIPQTRQELNEENHCQKKTAAHQDQ
jgi:hypothetical protein